MTKQDTGGPAFPSFPDGHTKPFTGMTMRDYFAAKAMQAQVGNPLKVGDDEVHRIIAARAYRVADAMLKAREA